MSRPETLTPKQLIAEREQSRCPHCGGTGKPVHMTMRDTTWQCLACWRKWPGEPLIFPGYTKARHRQEVPHHEP